MPRGPISTLLGWRWQGLGGLSAQGPHLHPAGGASAGSGGLSAQGPHLHPAGAASAGSRGLSAWGGVGGVWGPERLGRRRRALGGLSAWGGVGGPSGGRAPGAASAGPRGIQKLSIRKALNNAATSHFSHIKSFFPHKTR